MTRFRRQKRSLMSFRYKRLLKLCLIGFFFVVMFSRMIASPLANQGQPNIRRPSKWAYVFLLADVDAEKPFYRGLLYNILVSAYVLTLNRNSVPSTKAEIVVLVQMAATSKESTLPLPEEDFLKRMNVHVRYIDKKENNSPSSTFYQLVLAKFEVFKLTEYSRVLFLDSDVLPLCNLDYLLDLSEKGVLKETVLHAMYEDPVNAGMFVITPKPGYYEEIQSIIQKHGIPSKENWNPKVGWGDESVEYRLWNSKQGSGWDFYCADADQGLLLYWARFFRQDVSIIVGDKIEHYSGTSMETTSSYSLLPYSCQTPLQKGKGNRDMTFAKNAIPRAASLPVYQDFFHMVGYSKAWEMPPKEPIPLTREQVKSSSEYWYFLLQSVMNEFDVDNIIPPLSQLSEVIPKPRVRGDLITVGKGPVTEFGGKS